MNGPTWFACPHSDDVLAQHLDGQTTNDGVPTSADSQLAAHLADCDLCQQALRRARRLDAALAHEAGQFVAMQGDANGEPLAAARWFQAVAKANECDTAGGRERAADGDEAAAALSPAAVPSQRAARLAPRQVLATAGALLAIALMAVALWRNPDSALRTNSGQGTASHESSGAAAAIEPPTSRVAPTNASEHPTDPLPMPPAVGELVDVGLVHTEPMALALDLRRLPKWAKPSDAALARSAQGTELAGRAQGTALPESKLPKSKPPRVQPAAGRQPELAALRRQLDEGDVADAQLVFSTQLGRLDFDDAVRRHVRRCPERLDTVVAALRSGPRTRGTAQLLLDLWDDGVCRDRLADDEGTAERLFAGQPTGTFVQLQQELGTCAQAARRWRCLLALGRARGVDVTTSLLAHLEAPRHDERLVAAFALSCLPGPQLLRLAPRASTSCLLRAALLRSDAAELADFAAHCGEPLELRQRLRGASLPVFCELATWRRHVADASE